MALRNTLPKRRVSPEHRSPEGESTKLNRYGRWILSLICSFNGQRIRVFTVVDTLSRDALAIMVGNTLMRIDVVRILEDTRRGREHLNE